LRNLSRVMHRRLTIAGRNSVTFSGWQVVSRGDVISPRVLGCLPNGRSMESATCILAFPSKARVLSFRLTPCGFRWTRSSYKGFSVIRSDLKSHYRVGTLAHRRPSRRLVVAWRRQRSATWKRGPAARNKNTSLLKTAFISEVGSFEGKVRKGELVARCILK